jgi:hypothetical protein
MKDYVWKDRKGRDVPVAEMSDADLDRPLTDGFGIDGEETREAILERLRLEKFIGTAGLR